jgi:hypothetical protein
MQYIVAGSFLFRAERFMATSRSALPDGYVLNDYEIVDVIGAGGFGITYRARDLALKRHFAIKEYSPFELSSREGTTIYPYDDSAEDYEKGLEDFLLEAETLARFSHPNIVGVARFFRANGTAYMVLNFEQGSSFKEWLRDHEGPVTQAELDAILNPLLDALQLIHADGVLHRDIAPDNIYIRKNGTPVLLDFGSARQSLSRSHSMSAIVKAGYSPQEQYSSRASNQGPWTDIYSLAATVYRAVAGSVPPEASDRTVQDDYIPLSRQRPAGFRQTFLASIDWAMELRPSDRPQSIEEWRDSLLKDKPVPARAKASVEKSMGAPLPRASGSIPLWPMVAVAILFAALAGGSTWLFFNGQLVTARQETAVANGTIQSLQLEAAASARLAEEAKAEMERLKVDSAVRDRALQQQIADSEGRAAALANDLEAAQAAAVAGSNGQIEALQAALQEERSRTEELGKAAAANRTALNAATRRYEDAEARATKAEADAAAESERAREALAKALERVDEFQAAEAIARAEAKATQAKLIEAQSQFTADLETLKSEKEASDARQRTLEAQLSDAKANAAVVVGDNTAAQSRISELQALLDTERKKSDELTAENGKAVNRLNSTISSLTDQLTAQNAEVKSAVTTLQEVRANAATEIAAAEKRAAEAHNAAANAESALKKAQVEASDSARVASAREAEAEQQLADLDAQLKSAQAELEAGSATAAAQIKELQETYSSQLRTASDTATAAQKAKAEADAKVAELTDRLTAEQAVLADAKEAAATAQAKSQELTDQLSQRVASLQANLRAAAVAETEAKEALAAAMALSEKDAATAGEQRTALQASIAALEKQISDQQAAREALTAERDLIKSDAEKRIAELESKVASLSESTEIAVAETRAALRQEIESLRNLGAVPSTRFSGLEVAPAEDSNRFIVRAVEAESPFAGLVEAGMLIERMSVSGDAVDFADSANLDRLLPAACDPVSLTVQDGNGNRTVDGRIPPGFAVTRAGPPVAISVAGLAAVNTDPAGRPLISSVDTGSVAALAGLLSGDHLISFGDTSPADASALGTMVTEAAQRGGTVNAIIERECERQQIALDFGDVVQSFDWAGIALSGAASAAPRITDLASTSPFADSGLLVGDQINSVEAGGTTVELPGETGAERQLAGLRLCGDVRVAYSRGSAAGSLSVTMAPDRAGSTPVDYSDFGFSGLALASGGVLVETISDTSPFSIAGLGVGDVVVGVGPTTGPAVGTIGEAARQRFLRQGGEIAIANGCGTQTMTVAAYDPAKAMVDLATLSSSQRRLIIRALHGLGHYASGALPATFVATGTVDTDISDSMLSYRASQSQSATAGLSSADVQRLIPLGQKKMPSELEDEVLSAVLPQRVVADPGLVESRMRLFAATKGYVDPNGRQALQEFQRVAGAADPGYVTTEDEARAIFTQPLTLREAPASRRQFGDWRVHEINNDCAIYTLPVSIFGAFYRYTDNASFSDRPAIWLKVAKAASGQRTTQMAGDFGGAGSEFDPLQPVVMVTDDGKRLTTRRSRESVVPTTENGASSNALQKGLLASSWVDIVGTSKYGGELRIRYSAEGFRDAFDYLNNTCARGGLGPYLQ